MESVFIMNENSAITNLVAVLSLLVVVVDCCGARGW